MSMTDNTPPSRDPLPYQDVSEDDYAQRAADRNFVLDLSEPGFRFCGAPVPAAVTP